MTDAAPGPQVFDRWLVGFSIDRGQMRVHFPIRDAAGDISYGAGVPFDHQPEIDRKGVRASLFQSLLTRVHS